MSYSYRELIAWQKAKALAIAVYRETEEFPSVERFGLRSQLRRCAVSIPSNIAEGQGRLTPGEFRQFLGQARGSLLELQTQLEIASELGFLNEEQFNSLNVFGSELLRILNGLLDRIAKPQSQHMPARRSLETPGVG